MNMKSTLLFFTILLITLNDLLSNLYFNKIQFIPYNHFLILTQLSITGIIGWIFWRKSTNILLLYLWLVLYGFFLFNYTIRWLLSKIGLLNGPFIVHSYVGFGLSPLTFGSFYLLYRLLLPKQDQGPKKE